MPRPSQAATETLDRVLARKKVLRGIKRTLDVIGALALLALLWPLLLLSALLVRVTSPGPVLFRQKRVGRFGREFVMLKFRSMRVECPGDWIARSRKEAESGKLLKSDDDPRITRLGKFLRKWSLDELPQLLNVLKGDMSLVGPRPLLGFMLDPFPEVAAVRALVRPGLTGLWQVSGRADNTSLAGMADYDLEYVRTLSLWGDLKILARTLPAVISRKGAW